MICGNQTKRAKKMQLHSDERSFVKLYFAYEFFEIDDSNKAIEVMFEEISDGTFSHFSNLLKVV